MNKKFFAISSIILIAILGLSLSQVIAKNDSENSALPEEEGTYDVPGHPELKVKVFIYKVKPDQNPSPSPVLVCNLTDPNSTATVGATGWKIATSAWLYTLNVASVPASVGAANLTAMSADAFSRWSAAANNKVNFIKNLSNATVTKASFDGKNIITWGRAPGSALAITYTWYNQTTGQVRENDTIMNTKFRWSWSDPSTGCADSNSYDAQDILTHELGHWLGLNDMYTAADYQNATMYGYGSKGEIKKDTLSKGDITGTGIIYPN